jgi:hypothetical protein
MLQSIHEGTVDPGLPVMKIDALFHLGGFMNTYNTFNCGIKNPTQYMKVYIVTRIWVCGARLLVGE